MSCLTSRESLEVLAVDSVGRSSGREEATSIRIMLEEVVSIGVIITIFYCLNHWSVFF